MNPQDLLLADLEHFGNALLKNEEIGEKRFEFVVTLSTAVVGGLVAFATADSEFARQHFPQVLSWSLCGLLIFGLLSYLRMLQRNRVTDEHKRTLKQIRKAYKAAVGDDLSGYHVPSSSTPAGWERWVRAGYAETLGLLNGLLVGVLLAMNANGKVAAAVGIGVGVLLGAGLWILAVAVRRRPEKKPAVYFRAGAGAIILNDQGLVLAIERKDHPGSWQCPQGGIEAGEAPFAAAQREIREETGVASDDLELVAQYPVPLAYHLPRDAQSSKTGLGQVQFWFLFRCRRPVTVVLGEESRNSAWRPFGDIAANAVAFRRPLYEQLLPFAASHGAR